MPVVLFLVVLNISCTFLVLKSFRSTWRRLLLIAFVWLVPWLGSILVFPPCMVSQYLKRMAAQIRLETKREGKGEGASLPSTFERRLSIDEKFFANKIALQALKTKHNYRKTVLIGLFGFLLVRVITLGNPGFFIIFGLVPLAVMSWGSIRLFRSPKSSRLILWLRKFHRRDLRIFPFGRLLQQICLGSGSPVTIQDSTYRWSHSSLLAKGSFAATATYFLSFCTAFLASSLLLLVASAATTYLPKSIAETEVFKFVFFGIILPIGSLYLLFIVFSQILRRACFTMLNEKDFQRVICKLVHRSKQGKGSTALRILRSHDCFWQRAVILLLQNADAVVIDVTDMNASVKWELVQVHRLVPPERLVLCCARKQSSCEHSQSHLINQLSDILSMTYLEKTYRVMYSIPVKGVNLLQVFAQPLIDIFGDFIFEDDYNDLQASVLLALSYSKS